jgi:chemotaxis protein MotD
VSSVASETSPSTFKSANQPPRPPAPDRAPPEPFASLLDDSAPPPPPAADSEPPPPAAADNSPPPAKANDSDAANDDVQPAVAAKPAGVKADAKSDTTAANNSDKTAKTGKKAASKTAAITKPDGSDIKTDTKKDTKKDAKADAKTDAKAGTNAAAAQALAPSDAATAAVQGTDSQLPAGPADGTAVPAVAVVPVAVAQAPAAAAAPQLVNLAALAPTTAAKPATTDVAANKTDGKQSGDHAASADKTAPATPADGGPQAVAKDSDKDADKDHSARGDQSADSHRFAPVSAQPAAAGDTQTASAKTPDAAQPIALTAPAQNAAPATATQAATAAQLAPQAAAVPLAGIAIDIAGKALAGKNRFEIRLDPPELGRIEVHLDVDRDGNVTSHLIADRQDTLNLLQRDASGLQRALQDAGLKTADSGLQFSLRDQSGFQQQSNNGSNHGTGLVVQDDFYPVIDTVKSNYSRLAGMGSGVDIRI